MGIEIKNNTNKRLYISCDKFCEGHLSDDLGAYLKPGETGVFNEKIFFHEDRYGIEIIEEGDGSYKEEASEDEGLFHKVAAGNAP